MLSQASEELEGALKGFGKGKSEHTASRSSSTAAFGVEKLQGLSRTAPSPRRTKRSAPRWRPIRRLAAASAIPGPRSPPFRRTAPRLTPAIRFWRPARGYGSQLFGYHPRSFATLWLRFRPSTNNAKTTREALQVLSKRAQPGFGKTNPTPNVFGCVIHGPNPRGGTGLFTTEVGAAVRPLAEDAVLRSKPRRMAAATRFIWELEGGTLYRPDWPPLSA